MTAVVRALSFVMLEDDTVPLGLPDRLRDRAVALAPDMERCAHCGDPVGAVLVGDSDERIEWRTTVVVDNGHRTWLLCEDCGCPLDPAVDVIAIDAPIGGS